MKTDIIIPTNKYRDEIDYIVKAIESNTYMSKYNINVTCLQVSAATNRNFGLIHAKSDYVIMLDDDISGFYLGWAEDMLKPFEDDSIMMVSARLMNTPDEVGVMMDIIPDLSKPLQVIKPFTEAKTREMDSKVPVKAVPSACIAFKNDGILFDENYVGAGFEDTDFCFKKCSEYPDKKIVINNECKLIHRNEMKNQLNGQLQKNQLYFRWKWGLDQ